MRQKSVPTKEPAEQVIKGIRRSTRRRFSADDKIRIVLEGLRGEEKHRRALPPRGDLFRTSIIAGRRISQCGEARSDGPSTTLSPQGWRDGVILARP
jgi:hypothetical protein